jgi:flagellar motor switch protein FliN/FliY
MAGDSEQIGQDEIENLLRQATGAAPAASSQSAPQASGAASGMIDQSEIERLLGGKQTAAPTKAASPSRSQTPIAGGVAAEDIDLLLRKAEQALASIDDPVNQLPDGVKSFRFEDFNGASPNAESATLELMRDVQLDLVIELGRTHMHLEDVLKLRQGAVVPLDKLAGDPADIYVNGRLIARGEVLVLNDNFCVRVAELIVGEAAVA